MQAYEYIKGTNGYDIPYLQRVPQGASRVIIVSHGFGSSKRSVTGMQLMEQLPEKGIGVVAYDFPFHGDSPATCEDLLVANCVRDLKTMEDMVAKKWPEAKIAYFGSSFGAFITLLYLNREERRGDKAMLRCAAVNMPALFEKLTDKELAELEETGRCKVYEDPLEMVSKGFVDEIGTIDLMKDFRTKAMEDTEIRMIHGTGDETIDYHAAVDFAKKFAIPLTSVAGGDHSLTIPGAQETVLAKTLEFLEAPDVREMSYVPVFAQFEAVSGFFTQKCAAVNGAPFNNMEFLEALGLGDTTRLWPEQVHKDTIAVIREKGEDFEKIPETDGVVTDVPGVLLATVHADCLPVYFYDPEHGAIGVVHAGWRGTNFGIGAKCVRVMTEEYGTDPANLQAYVGPGISACCFEVGPEVRDEFAKNWEFVDEYARREGEKYFIDLKGMNRKQLLLAGLKSENIGVSEHCTYHEPEMFCSYRREQGTPMRMAAGLCLLEERGNA